MRSAGHEKFLERKFSLQRRIPHHPGIEYTPVVAALVDAQAYQGIRHWGWLRAANRRLAAAECELARIARVIDLLPNARPARRWGGLVTFGRRLSILVGGATLAADGYVIGNSQAKPALPVRVARTVSHNASNTSITNITNTVTAVTNGGK